MNHERLNLSLYKINNFKNEINHFFYKKREKNEDFFITHRSKNSLP